MPADWRGGLPITYRFGPGAGRAHLKLAFNWDQKPLYDVIARLRGSTYPDEWVIRGNHHDAWVNGAEDPAERHGGRSSRRRARSASCASRAGRPKRTIVYCAWDGEEPALLGSTEWVEKHDAELQQHAVVYINSDGNGRGFLQAEGSHALEHFINDVARDIQDPETHLSVVEAAAGHGDRRRPSRRTRRRSAAAPTCASARSDRDPTSRRSCSTSASPTLNIGFGGEDDDGIYHSVYDDFYFYTHFLDTDFAYGRALAQTGGTAVIRLADADLLPFQYTNLADTVRTYDDELRLLLKKKREEIRERNREIADGVFAAINDPRRPMRGAEGRDRCRRRSSSTPISRAIEVHGPTGGACSTTRAPPQPKGAPAACGAGRRSTSRSRSPSSSCSTRPASLHRDWFKHLLYAPGFYTGYGVKTHARRPRGDRAGAVRQRARRDRPRRQGAGARSGVAGVDRQGHPPTEIASDSLEVRVEFNRRQFIGVASGAAALLPLHGQAAADDPLGVRNDFPAVREGLYLNSAYIAPVPRPVVDEARAFAERKGSNPIALDEMLRKTNEVRGQFARFIKADPDEVGFLFATSEGENIVAAALDLKPGDNVVVDELHYETTFVLYRHLEETRRIELRIVKHRGGRVTVDDFEPAVDGRTRLVSVAWVSHQNGFRHQMRPLADLAHAHGALLYTDAVQALGMFPIDVGAAGVDCLTSGTYKWLLGGFGVAPFFIRRALLERIAVDRRGALHVEKELDDHRFEIYRSARKFEYATLPFAEVYQLGAALTYLERVGVDRIERHTVGLAHQLREGLASLGFRMFTPAGNDSSIVTLHLDGHQSGARETLDRAGAKVSFREQGSQIRISPSLFNTGAEVVRFLEALAKTFA